MQNNNFLKYYLPFIAYALLVILVSSIPRLPEPDLGISFLDKIAHFLEYFIFSLLGLRAIDKLSLRYNTTIRYTLFGLFSIVFAALDEWHQIFIPGRQTDFFDFVFDSFGLIMGIIFFGSFFNKEKHL